MFATITMKLKSCFSRKWNEIYSKKDLKTEISFFWTMSKYICIMRFEQNQVDHFYSIVIFIEIS